ncbi:MAG: prepilin-type N-terminal cleavage/methylation domain-containing protein, partial [Casimicrobiaceae bacterium]
MCRGPTATSCTAGRRRRGPARLRAFTLVEILVVIVILGIAAGIALALVAPDERDLSLREARRFAGTIEYAAQRAQWRDRMLGVSVGGNVIRYWRRDDAGDRWLLVDDDDVLASRALPAPVQAAALVYAGRALAADAIVPPRSAARRSAAPGPA